MVLNHQWLIDLGITGLTEEDAESLIHHIRDTLETRVGERLAVDLTDTQLEEFESVNESGDMDAARAWLSTNCPGYQQVVEEELISIGNELKENKERIN